MPDPSTYGTFGGGVMEGVAAAHERSREDRIRRESQSLEMFKILIQAGCKPVDLNEGVEGGVVIRVGDAYLEPPPRNSEKMFQLKLAEQETKAKIQTMEVEYRRFAAAAQLSKAEADTRWQEIRERIGQQNLDAKDVEKATQGIKQEIERLKLEQQKLGGGVKPTDKLFHKDGKVYVVGEGGKVVEIQGPEGVDLTGLQPVGGEPKPTLSRQLMPLKLQNHIDKITFPRGKGYPPRTVFDQTMIQSTALVATQSDPPMDVYRVAMDVPGTVFGETHVELLLVVPKGTKPSLDQVVTKYASVYDRSKQVAAKAVQSARQAKKLQIKHIRIQQ